MIFAQGDDEIVFQTADGFTSTSDVAEIVVDELDETVKPHVLDETPAVLSIGRRCVKMGYAFHWMPGKLPFMVTPKQGFVHLQVKDDSSMFVHPCSLTIIWKVFVLPFALTALKGQSRTRKLFF